MSAPAGGPSRATTAPTTSRLLWGAVLAGPVYVLAAAGQVVAREGFDLRRHAISLLSNGELGWIQIANFVVAGVLVMAGAVGLRRVLDGRGVGAVWGPRLLMVYGLGLVASGVFVADPADGFPPGTSPGLPDEGTWQGALHFVAGGIAFVGLIAACIVLARRFAREGEGGWAVWSAATGILFAVSFALLAGAPDLMFTNQLFTVGVVASWVWLSALGWRHLAPSRHRMAR